MIEFRQALFNKVTDTLKTAVDDEVVTWSDHLHDLDDDQFPFIVVNVRTAEKSDVSDREIGNKYDLYMWTVHIYYLDLSDTYAPGDQRRDRIVGKIIKVLEEDRRLGNLENTSPDGHREYVFDSSISAALFDTSGQEEYHSFVSEVYLNVYTAKS